MNRAWRGVALGVVLGVVAIGVIAEVDSSAQNSACLSTSDPDAHHLWGRPDGTPASNELVVHHDYELSQNTSTKFADWAAYRLDGSTFPGPDRERDLRLDPCLSGNRQVTDDRYENAHDRYEYDRGHLAPLATFEGSQYWREVNVMSNIVPMHQTLNSGVWAQLEAAIRQAVESDNPLYVLTGTAYENGESMPKLPNANPNHRVPSDYWKIVATGEPGNPDSFQVTAFLFDQHGCVVPDSCTFSREFENNRVPVDRVEELTGFDFFPELPQNRQQQVESVTGDWPPSPVNDTPDDPMTNVVLHSLLPNPPGNESGTGDEWIKVINNGDSEADVSDLRVCDDQACEGLNVDMLAPGETTKVQSCFSTQGLCLRNSGETVTLEDTSGNVLDSCSYSDAQTNEVIDCLDDDSGDDSGGY